MMTVTRARLLASAAMGIGLAMIGTQPAQAACVVSTTNNPNDTVTCGSTTTTDATRLIQFVGPAGPTFVDVSAGATVDGFGLAVTSQLDSPNTPLTVTNDGLISVDAGNTPTNGGSDADRPEATQRSPLRFQLPGHVGLDHLQKDTSAVGRYAAMEAADTARTDYEDYFGGRRLAPGEFNWRAEPSKPTAMHIVVSIPDQRAYVYEGPVLIAVSTVSTGRRGHPTPNGAFPIIEKHRLKLSNLYDDAPMHYMQRLTMDGIALHAGYIPGVPASHGSIRLPMAFAQKPFSLTTSGTPVFIAA